MTSIDQLKDLLDQGYTIEASPYLSDYDTVKRTWKERLFTRPWKPFQKTKVEYSPQAFLLESHIIVSYKTYSRLK